MDDLNYGDPGHGIFQVAMRAVSEAIAELDRIGAAEALLRDDFVHALT